MRALLFSCLLAVVALTGTNASAASFLRVTGDVVGPILYTGGLRAPSSPHGYSGADLEPGAHLTGISLEDASLTWADLAGSTLTAAALTGSKLTRASFANASLVGADLDFAHLRYTEFEGATVTGASFAHADLYGANFTGVGLTGVDFDFVDLRAANLTNAFNLSTVWGTVYYDANTNFDGASANGGSMPFDPAAAGGWVLVPEPSTALLLGMGLVGLVTLRRR